MPRIYTYKTLVGKRFTRLTVLSEAYKKSGSRFWECRCDCGEVRIVRGNSLVGGRTKSCGCLSREVFLAHSLAAAPSRRWCRTVQAGQRFGKLVAINYLSNSKGRDGSWLCRCDCGIEKPVRTYSLTSGEVISCGCLWRDKVRRIMIDANTTHGMSNRREYPVWTAMMHRCLHPDDLAYGQYGGAGIIPCQQLQSSPKALLALLGPRPEGDYQLDRIDNLKGYFCGECDDCKCHGRKLNVRWATRTQNLRNRRNNALFKINDEIHCASEWAERLGLTRGQFIYRYRANKYVATDIS